MPNSNNKLQKVLIAVLGVALWSFAAEAQNDDAATAQAEKSPQCTCPGNVTVTPPAVVSDTQPVAAEQDTPEALPEIVQAGEITYLTGGIGEDERTAMEAVKSQYNMELTSAMKEGPFVSDTHIKITDQKKKVVLDTYMGPIFYAKVPPGTYVIEAFFGKESRNETATFDTKSTTLVRFGWKLP